MMLALFLSIGFFAKFIFFASANLEMLSFPKIQFDNFEKNISNTSYHRVESLPLSKLQQITINAKEFSHAKGPFRVENDGRLGYRRSLIKKLQRKTNSLALNKILKEFDDTSEDNTLHNLDVLKHLVHELDAAIEFVNNGGMDLLKEFIHSDNSKIISASFSVLAAAMQGNPHVQSMAMKNKITEINVAHLDQEEYLPSVLFALSSHLRQMPLAQLKFARMNGVFLLAGIMKNYNHPLIIRIRALEIIGDMAFEMYEVFVMSKGKDEISAKELFFGESSPDDKKTNKNLLIQDLLGIRTSGACKEVGRLFECKHLLNMCDVKSTREFFLLSKIIFAMEQIHSSCYMAFQSMTVKQSLKYLLELYDPLKEVWYSSIDREFKYAMYEDLVVLYEELYKEL